MTRPVYFWLIALFAVIFPSPVGAEDKPSQNPVDSHRATLVKAGYIHIPLALNPAVLCFSAEGSVGPEKTKFFINSGGRETVLDLKLAKRLKLELGEEVELGGVLWAGRHTSRAS